MPTDSIYDVPVWYFSYGSNLDRDTFTKRFESWGGGQIRYSRASVASLAGWDLAFNMFGFPPKEPAFASIEPGSKSSVVHGMAYLLEDAGSWRKLLESEGAPDRFYDAVRVRISIDEDGTMADAVTLVGKPWVWVPPALRRHVRPSKRYRDLVVEGARKEGLPAVYVEKIAALRAANSSESKVMEVLGMFSGVWSYTACEYWLLRPTVWARKAIGSRLMKGWESDYAVVRASSWVAFVGMSVGYAALAVASIPFNKFIWRKLGSELGRVFGREK